jgi:hypothetical protein
LFSSEHTGQSGVALRLPPHSTAAQRAFIRARAVLSVFHPCQSVAQERFLVSIFWSDNMPRRVAPQTMKMKSPPPYVGGYAFSGQVSFPGFVSS